MAITAEQVAELGNYRVARTPREYAQCHALLREQGREGFKLRFPTVILEREGLLQGFLGTMPRDNAVIAGPLAVREGLNRGWVTVKLVERYETVLRFADVKEYLIPVAKKNESLLKSCMRLWPEDAYADTDEDIWFRRILSNV